MDQQDVIIKKYEEHEKDDNTLVIGWFTYVLLYLISISALVVAVLAYRKPNGLSGSDEAKLSKISFTGNTLIVDGLSTTGIIDCNILEVKNEVKDSLQIETNLQINGYENAGSDQISVGLQFETTLKAVALPNGVFGGDISEFNPILTKVIISGTGGTNTAGSTSDGGATWLQLTTPFANPGIEYSVELNIYSGLDIGGTAVYTSVSGVDGSWVIGTPYIGPGTFSNGPTYIPEFLSFYTSTTDLNFRVAVSTNGSVYTPQASTRDFIDMAYSPILKRLVTVGNFGPQYTDDGKTWINATSTAVMSEVCYSNFWKKFVF